MDEAALEGAGSEAMALLQMRGWYGYYNSDVLVNGERMMFISSAVYGSSPTT